MDGLYLEQVWAGNDLDAAPPGRRLDAARPGAPALLPHQQGPVVRLDHNAPFGRPASAPKPEGRQLLPGRRDQGRGGGLDRTRRAGARRPRGFFTVVRRGADGRFEAVPYDVAYQGTLAAAAELLREAADLTPQPSLAGFLRARADAFLSNDYYASDVAWMELDSSIEPTIGPYEVYTDEWFNLKAAFEAFITVRDDAETEKLRPSASTCRGSRTRCRSTRSTATPSSARSRPSGSSTRSSPRATATTPCRPPPSTCRTTSASSRRWARSG